jgi:exopolysaccharide biosynthesis polyprenyl glycosylphosphotransferase
MASAESISEPSTPTGLTDETAADAVAAAPPWSVFTPVKRSAQDAVRRRDAIHRRLLAAADLLSTAAALLLGVIVVAGQALSPLVLLTLLPAVVVVAKALGLYDRDQHLLKKTTLEEIPTLFHMTILTAFAVWVLAGLLDGGARWAAGALVLWATMFVGIVTTRTLARMVGRRLAPPERCVVIGGEAIADELVAKLEADPGIMVEFVQLDDVHERLDDPRKLAEVGAFLLDHQIHRVVLAGSLGDRNREELLPVIGEIKRLGLRISLLPSVSRTGRSSFEVDRVDGITLLGARGYEFSRSSRILKRAMDLTISAAALVVLGPLFAVITIAIKLDSRGPVLYRQTRIGRHGQPFEMVKFRTMYERAHEQRERLAHLNGASGGLFKIEDDPRVTRVGRFLRSFSIDELPQLWNVLRGQMSLVGPRPLVTEEDRLIEGWHRQRLELTPGMTGYWQVLGSARVPLEDMVRLDYSYVQNWSAWEDVMLLMRTVPLVARRRGV